MPTRNAVNACPMGSTLQIPAQKNDITCQMVPVIRDAFSRRFALPTIFKYLP